MITSRSRSVEMRVPLLAWPAVFLLRYGQALLGKPAVAPGVGRGRAAFTLIELMITISIIAIMASMMLFALYSAQETAKEAKTKALIARLDSIIKAKWESYRTRRVPITIAPGTLPKDAATLRLNGLHDLMRMELPDRWSDICNLSGTNVTSTAASPTTVPPSSVWNGYVRKVQAAVTGGKPPSLDFQNAECLYMIVMSSIAEEGDAREVFKPDDVKDTDNDGFPEFVDAWGQPIRFLRWAPGFQSSELQIVARVKATSPSAGQVLVAPADATPLDTNTAAYPGGAIFAVSGTTNSLSTSLAAHITGYTPATATASAIFSVPSGGPSISGTALITASDPFDTYGIYAGGAAGSAPSFAIYPLIYSAGPDKVYGIVSDAIPPIGANTNPFVIITGSAGTELLGNARDIPAEPNYVTNGWLDNIHNHLLGTR